MSRPSSQVPTSSPLSSIPSSDATFKAVFPQSPLQYRPTAPLPFELQQSIHIYLEENLFSQAFDLLSALVSANAANEKKKIPIVAPEYLGLISTLTVHPSFTSRATSRDKQEQSNTALRLLWTLCRLVGPINAHLGEAYRFHRYDIRSCDRTRTSESVEDDWKTKLAIKYAEEESLFTLATDFWSAVGWAFNCSCLGGLHSARWQYWCQWLEYMLDTLERDWDFRVEHGSCDQSLLWQYVGKADGGNGKGRRILRSIFADGGATAIREFREIFAKELKPPRKDMDRSKKQEVAVDVDEDIYGDWMDESESETDEETNIDALGNLLNPRPSKRLRTRTPSARRRINPRTSKNPLTDHEESDSSVNGEGVPEKGLGGPEAISLRLRLLQLLANVAAHPDLSESSPDSAFPDLHELFTLFVEFIRPLPLNVFQQLVLSSDSGSELDPVTKVALCEFILQRIVENDHASNLSTFEPMSQERLVREYLPYTATMNTVAFQAKVSILVESLLRQLAREDRMTVTPTNNLRDALDRGVDARESKARGIRDSNRHKNIRNKDEDFALQLLEDSGMRMRYLLEQIVD